MNTGGDIVATQIYFIFISDISKIVLLVNIIIYNKN